MKVQFLKAYTKYEVGDSADVPATDASGLIALGLAVEVKEEAPAPKKGKEQVSE